MGKAAAQSDGGNIGYAMSDAVKVIDELLAGRKAEPVAWRYRTTDINGNPNPRWSFSEEESLMGLYLGLYQPLYTAPPAPVVPEEATPDNIEILASARVDSVVFQWDEDQRNAAADSWNACRAAMLSGGKS